MAPETLRTVQMLDLPEGRRLARREQDQAQLFGREGQSVTKDQVAAWSKALGGWEKMINKAGYTWRGLPPEKTANLTEARAVALAVENPSLIRRPLIEHTDGSVTVGFSKKIQEMLA